MDPSVRFLLSLVVLQSTLGNKALKSENLLRNIRSKCCKCCEESSKQGKEARGVISRLKTKNKKQDLNQMDLHAFTKSLLWLNLASKLSLEDMIWKTWSCWGFEATLACFSLFSPSSSAFWFVCFLSQIALSSPGPSELETAYLLLCSGCCWPEAPINFKGH